MDVSQQELSLNLVIDRVAGQRQRYPATRSIRETFNTWTPTYFMEVLAMTKADAASYSAVFPLFGGVSVIFAGIAGDKLGGMGRSLIILTGLLLSTAGLFILPSVVTSNSIVTIFLIGFIGFTLIGPYSYLAGALSLDLGGKHGGATASGIIDGVGYLGGVLAGGGIARLTIDYGWNSAFFFLANVAITCSVAALLFCLTQRHKQLNAFP